MKSLSAASGFESHAVCVGKSKKRKDIEACSVPESCSMSDKNSMSLPPYGKELDRQASPTEQPNRRRQHAAARKPLQNIELDSPAHRSDLMPLSGKKRAPYIRNLNLT